MGYAERMDFSTLVGLTLTKIENNGDELIFETDDGRRFWMGHNQDCCESVYVEDIVGDLDDLIGTPILAASEDTSGEDPPDLVKENEYRESFTWTFYNIRTIKGSVTIRWYGSSNGYYSESVDFELLK